MSVTSVCQSSLGRGEAIHAEGAAESKCPARRIRVRFTEREAPTHESKSAGSLDYEPCHA